MGKRREQLAHYANDNAYLTTSTGRTGHSTALDTRSCRTEIMPATTDTALKPCQRRSTASRSSLPSTAFEKKKSPIPVLDLAPLGIEPICYLTEEISNQLLAKYIWYSKHITVSHEESTTNLLARMGFQRRIAGTYIKAPEAVVEAWLNEDYSTLLSEFKVFHSPTGHYWQLGILTTLPLEKAVKAWNALTLSPHTDTEYAMLHFGLKRVTG